MKNSLYILLILISFNCSDSKTKETQRTELRNLTIFEFDSLLFKAEYDLIIGERDSVTIYNYSFKSNSKKNMNFRYLKYSDQLQFGPFKFDKIESDKYAKTFGFNLYDSDSDIVHGMGPVLFNEEYGILGFDNGVGTQYYFTNENTKNLKFPIFYIQESAESILLGKWKLNNPNFYNEIHFFENNIWKRIFKDYKNDTIIQKGKYTIAKDSAIFFRYFGSQHWPNNDTINDYKTSIGGFLLFLNPKNELIDNQEDYEQKYRKLK